jgi:hypothetical protein
MADIREAKRLVLGSTLDPDNDMSRLRGNALVLHDIFDRVDLWNRCKAAVQRMDHDAYLIVDAGLHKMSTLPAAYSQIAIPGGIVVFPEPRDVHVNMMPFKLFDPVNTLPEYLHQYVPIIAQCPVTALSRACYDKVAYLTVHECAVAEGASQRRPGLHVERHVGPLSKNRVGHMAMPCPPGTPFDVIRCSEFSLASWGLGHRKEGWPIDGIFMASSVSDSCAVWPEMLDADRCEGIVDRHGGITEEMREHLGEPRLLKAGELCWITDLTPHESLKVEHAHYRQFFRLVVGPVSVWYSKHNTANPTGTQPDAPVSDADKFHGQTFG